MPLAMFLTIVSLVNGPSEPAPAPLLTYQTLNGANAVPICPPKLPASCQLLSEPAVLQMVRVEVTFPCLMACKMSLIVNGPCPLPPPGFDTYHVFGGGVPSI